MQHRVGGGCNKNNENLSDLWYNTEYSTLNLTGVLEGKEKINE